MFSRTLSSTSGALRAVQVRMSLLCPMHACLFVLYSAADMQLLLDRSPPVKARLLRLLGPQTPK